MADGGAGVLGLAGVTPTARGYHGVAAAWL